MEIIKLTPLEQEFKKETWKSVCNWFDKNPLSIIVPAALYIITAVMVGASYQNTGYSIVLIIIGILTFLFCRLVVREISCNPKIHRKKFFHEKGIY
jgi:hypothetical protein